MVDLKKASRIAQGVAAGWGKKGAKGSTAPPRPFVKQQTLADRKVIAKGNVRNATASARNKGTYDTYDPLSSIRAPRAPRKPKTRTVAKKRKG